MISIRGGTVLTAEGLMPADVSIEGDSITYMGQDAPEAAIEVDAAGCLVGPGFVDIHVHFRDPGQTWKEDLETGARAASKGGYTGVVAMPNTDPAIDTPERVRVVLDRSRSLGIDLQVAPAATLGREGVEISDLEGLYAAGGRLFSDDGDCVADRDLLREILIRIGSLPGAVLAQHAEDPELARGGHMHSGELSRTLGIDGLAREAEHQLVESDLRLVAETGSRYHCQHVSALETVGLIREAKDKGLPVTAEVTPHHLALTEEDVAGLHPNMKMYPPLRTAEDRKALLQALRDGTIDAVATDHAPHTSEEKDVPFEEAPRGVIGLETAAAIVWRALDEPLRFFEVMSSAPARIASLDRQGHPVAVGAPANLVVFDPMGRWTAGEFESKSSNTPFGGWNMKGRVTNTIYEGKITHRMDSAGV